MHILYSVQTRTHPGKVRENNEDALGTALEWKEKLGLSDDVMQQRGHLFAVADGMGGHAAGEVASQMAIDILFTEYYTGEWHGPRKTLTSAIQAANRAIWKKAEENAGMSGMGTTLVAALYQPNVWLIANVGDSRAYLFRSGRIKQITEDHSWVVEQVNSGILTEEEAARHPFRNVITRSLGGEPEVRIDFFDQDAQPGDIMLLCSDGLSNLVAEKEMQRILQAYALDEAAERFLELSLERGAPDNVTFELIQLVGEARRHSRSFLPWLALGIAAFLIGGFVYWNFLRDSETSVAPAVATPSIIATYTSVSTPDRPLVATPSPVRGITPTETPAPKPESSRSALTSFGRIDGADAIVFATPDASDNRILLFVSGVATVEPVPENPNLVSMTLVVDGGKTFSTMLDKSHYVGQHVNVLGGRMALMGYAEDGLTSEADQALTPLLVLSPFPEGELFAVVWRADDDATSLFLRRFGLDGELISENHSPILQLHP